jgi:hypothetical protein
VVFIARMRVSCMPLRRWQSFAFERGGVIGLITLLLYVFLAPSHIVDGDNAEFVTLGALGGTAHPTGYPAYVLWLRAWSWLPGNAPQAAAIATAILGAAQMSVLVNACRAWGVGTAAANAAVAIFAGAPVILAMYTEAEVFAMNGLVAALVIWLSAREAPLRGPWRCGVLALVAGLGMANHVTCTLVAPIGVLGVVRGVRETDRKGRAIAFALVGFVLGLTPYLYLLIAPDHAGTWGKPETLGDLMHLFLRTDYGGPGSFAARGDERYPVENLIAFGETLVRTWLWVPGIAGVVMIGYRIARPTGETRLAWLALATSFLIAGPLLVLRFNLMPGRITTTYVIERFHILPMLLLVVFVAAALDLAFARVPERLRSPRWGAVLLVVGFAAIAGRSLGHIVRAHAPAVEQQVRNTMRSLPPRSVVIGATDDLKAGIAYLQLVENERTDIFYINWPMMSLPWYRARVVAEGIPFTRGEPGVASVVVAERVLASGRPLFADSLQANILKALPHYPYGTLFRVLPRGEQAPSLDEIFKINQEVYAKFELTYPRPGPDDRWATNVHVKYAFTWRQLAAALRKAGKLEEAAWAMEAAREIGPQ